MIVEVWNVYLQFIDDWWHKHEFKKNQLTEEEVFDVFLGVELLSYEAPTDANQHGESMFALE